MKIAVFSASLLVAVSAHGAFAQTDMSCADFLKANAQMMSQMSPADRAVLTADPAAAAMDKKVREWCEKNPRSPVSEAMMKALN